MRQKGTCGQGGPLVRGTDLQMLATPGSLLWLFPLPGTSGLRKHLSESFPDCYISGNNNSHTSDLFPCSSSSALITSEHIIHIY